MCQHVRTLNLALKGTCNVHMERYKCFTEAMTDVLLNVIVHHYKGMKENARCNKNNLSEKYLK